MVWEFSLLLVTSPLLITRWPSIANVLTIMLSWSWIGLIYTISILIFNFLTSFSRSPRLLSLDFGRTNASSDLAILAERKSAACEALRPVLLDLRWYLSPGDLDCDLACRPSRFCRCSLSRFTAELSESLGTSRVSWGVSPESSLKYRSNVKVLQVIKKEFSSFPP